MIGLKDTDKDFIYTIATQLYIDSDIHSEFYNLFDKETGKYRGLNDDEGEPISLQALLNSKIEKMTHVLFPPISKKQPIKKPSLEKYSEILKVRQDENGVIYSQLFFDVEYKKPWKPNSKVIISFNINDKEFGLLDELKPTIYEPLQNTNFYEIDEMVFSKLMSRLDYPATIEGNNITLTNSNNQSFRITVSYFDDTIRTPFSEIQDERTKILSSVTVDKNKKIIEILKGEKDPKIKNIVQSNIAEWIINPYLREESHLLHTYIDGFFDLSTTNGDFLNKVARLLVILIVS